MPGFPAIISASEMVFGISNCRQTKSKRCARAIICLGPQPAAMRLDDRAADRQAQAQAMRFGRVEGLE
jgi:hypothetical protein